MTAKEALKITMDSNHYKEAVEYGIKLLEEKIRDAALSGERECTIANFYAPPGPSKEFFKKHGEEAKYKFYDVEKDMKKYFTKNGFRFEYITNTVCGGAYQDPYWVVIKW